MVTSTLREQRAPSAPEIVTPGFAGNSKYLDRPIEFTARFIPTDVDRVPKVSPLNLPQLKSSSMKPEIVADRGY